MNKFKLIAVVLAGAFSTLAFAEEAGELTAGGQTSISPVTGSTNVCTLLDSAVNINLSDNVSGYYSCDFATSDIRVGTCHVAGSRAETTVACTDVDPDPDVVELSDDNCSTVGTDATYTDRSAFIATSTGGSVSKTAMGGATCSGANLGGLSFFN